MASSNNNNSNNYQVAISSDTGSILDAIKEQTTNIEAHTNVQQVNEAISDALKEMATNERNVRESTITIRNTEELSSNSIMEIIEKEWVNRRDQAPISYWQDKVHSFVQFLNQATKQVFMEHILSLKTKEPTNDLCKLISLIIGPNNYGHQLTRKEVRIEIPNVRGNIQSQLIDKILSRVKGTDKDEIITNVREGKLHGPPGHQSRSLMFKVNAKGFETIYGKMNGVIPYARAETCTKIRLYPRINARPWSCRDCFYIGPNHTCTGKACAQCGSKDHGAKDCRSKTRFCTNCKRRGHRARDLHCPAYIREVAKEIKRMDIPLDFIEEEEKRQQLVKALILK